MHVSTAWVVLCTILLGCHARPPPSSKIFSPRAKTLPPPAPPSKSSIFSSHFEHGQRSRLVLPRADGDGKPGGSRNTTAQLWRNLPTQMTIEVTPDSGTSLAPGSSLSSDVAITPNAPGDPSSSGPFTQISLPPNWDVMGWDPYTEQFDPFFSAEPCKIFYEKLIAECGKNLWSAEPTKVSHRLSLGELFITITALGSGATGIPWGVLALLFQGMLERSERWSWAVTYCLIVLANDARQRLDIDLGWLAKR